MTTATRHFSARLVLAGLVLVAAVNSASAQESADWPSKPIRIIVNFAPGGGSDNATRPFVEGLSRELGQQVVIENKGGASGAIGAEAVIKSAPDGYTFLATPSLTMVILPHLRKLAFDPVKDLVPVTSYAEGTLLITTHPSVPGNSIQELVTYAKQNPGKLSWGTASVGSYGHLICESFKFAAGVDILHIPYRGTGEVLADFLAGVVQIQADPVGLPHVATGKAKLLSVFGRKRRADYPNVLMMKEIYPDLDFVVWFGLFAPPGTPQKIVDRMAEALSKIAREPRIEQIMFGLALTPTPMTPAETSALLRSDFERYGKLTKQFNIRAE